jgi:dipeptidyl aminopeptidase/acylaminoacyl peptidase
MPKRAITTDDLFNINLIDDPQISPDGKAIAYVLTTPDLDQNKYHSHIWLIPSAGGKPRQFTFGAGKDHAPRWSPDGKWIAFLSNRDDEKKEQLYLISLSGGEAVSLTKGDARPSAAIWSPDGTIIAYTARVVTQQAKRANGARDDSDVRAYTRMNYKFDGLGFWDYGYRQIFVITSPPQGEGRDSRRATDHPAPIASPRRDDPRWGEGQQLTHGDFNYLEPAWSPDSKTIVFASNRSQRADETNITDLWSVPARGGAIKRLTRSKGPSHSPAFSPNGRSIAFIGHENEFGRVTQVGVYVVPARGGKPAKITAGFDRSYGDSMLCDLRAHPEGAGLAPVWSKDGKTLYFIATDGGSAQIFSVPARGGSVRQVTHSGDEIYDFSYSPAANRFALTVSDSLNPNDLFTCDARGSLKQLTRLNADLVANVALSRPEHFSFRNEGRTVEGWLLKPHGWSASRKYPALLEIHGGPHATFGNAFFHELQLLAANGYAVIFTNPRGSSGYGQDFTRAVCKDWGGGDYRDLLAAIDFALDKFSWIDSQRLGVLGGSYGGYMTSWVVTHTHRFQAAISERALNNWYSFSGTSDIGAFFGPDSEIGADVWDKPELHLAHSPIAHVASCKTPTLILHSENDFRCPVEQGEQFYLALKKLHVPTEFVRFPDESHNLSRNGKPKHRKERLERMLAWFRRYVD